MPTAPSTHSLGQSLVTVHTTLTAFARHAQAARRAQAEVFIIGLPAYLVLSFSNSKMRLLSVPHRERHLGKWDGVQSC